MNVLIGKLFEEQYQVMGKNLVGASMVSLGAFSYAMPELFASFFHLETKQPVGIVELRAYYGGAGIGLGAFIIACKSVKQALVLLRACMIPLGLIRLVSLWQISHLIKADPTAYLLHLFALCGVEIPMMFISSIALLVLEFPKTGNSTTTIIELKWRLLRRFAALLLTVESFAFLVYPKLAALQFGVAAVENRELSGLAEIKSMFGGQRLGFALFAWRGDDLEVRQFSAILFSFRAAFRAMALSQYIHSAADEREEVSVRDQVALVAMDTALALLFIRAYAQALGQKSK